MEEVGDQQLIFGSSIPYATFHQTGAGLGLGQAQLGGVTPRSKRSTGLGRGRALPMRPLITVSDERTASWVEMFRQRTTGASSILGASQLNG